MRAFPAAVVAAAAAALAWFSSGSTAARDWLPYGILLLLVVAVLLASGGALVPARHQLVALAALTGLAAWSGVSAAWSAAPALARDEALLTVTYAAALAVPLLTLRGSRDRLAALVAVVALGTALAVATAAALVLEVVDPEQALLTGRLVFPVSYHNAQAAVSLVAVWPALAVASLRAVPVPLRAAAVGGAAAMIALWIASQSKGAAVAFALSAIAVFALSPSRLRLLVPTLVAVGAAFAAFVPLTGIFRTATEAGAAQAMSEAGSATLLVAAGAAVLGLLYAAADRAVEPGPRLRRLFGWLVVAALIAGLAAASAAVARVDGGAVAFFEEKWEAFKEPPAQEPGSTHFASLGSNRWDFWRVAAERVPEAPLVGIGARSFEAAYLRNGASEETPTRAHSLPLEVLAETGVVGLLLLAASLAVPLAALALRRRDPLAVAAFGAAAYWIVHASGDWIWGIPAVTVTAFLVIGIGLATGGGRGASLVGSRRGLLLAAGVSAVALAAFAPPWLSTRMSDRALTAGSAAGAQEQLRWARRLDPLSVTPFVAEWASATRPVDAARALEKAVEREPRSAGLRLLLARTYLRGGQRERARHHLLVARDLYPRNPEIDDLLARTS